MIVNYRRYDINQHLFLFQRDDR